MGMRRRRFRELDSYTLRDRLLRVAEVVRQKKSVHYTELAVILMISSSQALNLARMAAAHFPDLEYKRGYLYLKEEAEPITQTNRG